MRALSYNISRAGRQVAARARPRFATMTSLADGAARSSTAVASTPAYGDAPTPLSLIHRSAIISPIHIFGYRASELSSPRS